MAAKNISIRRKEEKVIEEMAVPMFMGEIVMAKSTVLRYNTFIGKHVGIIGTLFFTNFKVAFSQSNAEVRDDVVKASVSSLANLEQMFLEDESALAIDYIPLTAIASVHVISTVKQKTKKVKANMKKISLHYDQLEIQTKDLRILRYDFRNVSESGRRSCFQTIAHYAFPRNVTQLFAFDYGQNLRKTNDNNGRAFCLFQTKKDYEMNMNRLKCSDHWRVTSLNEHFVVSKTLPQYNVCPASIKDKDIESFSSAYHGGRFPVWLWSHPDTGVALLVSSTIESIPISKTGSLKPSLKFTRNGLSNGNGNNLEMNEIKSTSHSTLLLDAVKSCQGNSGSGKATSINTDSHCPSLSMLHESFVKLCQQGCLTKSCKEYWNGDSSWLSLLEDSNWLRYISTCLELASTVASTVDKGRTSVVVTDTTGRDFSLVITSLAQIMLDPYYRTSIGLQALIQKDWVMKGHPFRTRFRHLSSCYHNKPILVNDSIDNSESPVFLLFLDCVHQLLVQYPSKFEYTQHFLVLLQDFVFSSLFGTFVFNSQKEFNEFSKENYLMTVWDFIATDIPQMKYNLLFTNSAYKVEELKNQMHTSQNNMEVDLLTPSSRIMDMKFWDTYFFRWIDNSNLVKGFSTSASLILQQHKILEEVEYLEERLIFLENALAELENDYEKVTPSKVKKHKYSHSRHENSYDVADDFLSLISSFYFLKIL